MPNWIVKETQNSVQNQNSGSCWGNQNMSQQRGELAKKMEAKMRERRQQVMVLVESMIPFSLESLWSPSCRYCTRWITVFLITSCHLMLSIISFNQNIALSVHSILIRRFLFLFGPLTSNTSVLLPLPTNTLSAFLASASYSAIPQKHYDFCSFKQNNTAQKKNSRVLTVDQVYKGCYIKIKQYSSPKDGSLIPKRWKCEYFQKSSKCFKCKMKTSAALSERCWYSRYMQRMILHSIFICSGWI